MMELRINQTRIWIDCSGQIIYISDILGPILGKQCMLQIKTNLNVIFVLYLYCFEGEILYIC